MEIEENRLCTFVNWPSDAPIDAARIAKGGFYSTGNEMEVQCHWCKGKIADWHYGDQVNNALNFCLTPFLNGIVF